MNRRQFLRNTLVAGAVAATCPTALKIAERFRLGEKNSVQFVNCNDIVEVNVAGTITGRITGNTKIGSIYQRCSGKTHAADAYSYFAACNDQQKKILRVTSNGQEIIQFGNESFAKLEKRVAAHFNMYPEQVRLLRS